MAHVALSLILSFFILLFPTWNADVLASQVGLCREWRLEEKGHSSQTACGGVGGAVVSSPAALSASTKKCLLPGLPHICLTTTEFKFKLVQGTLYVLPEPHSWIIDFASTQEIRQKGFSI